ncbi:hypothetical protein BJY52DRAFT_1132534, partial [Lactarius psammicola]
ISRDIVWKYVATSSGLSQSRARPEADRDQQYENQCLRNRDYLLYVDLCNALNSGDIGYDGGTRLRRDEASFLPWIYIFCGTGKHKYASQLARFMRNLHDIYPPDLSRIIQMNALCNPTGKPNTFQPADWLVEWNNLYTKVTRDCHVIIETAFQLTYRTLRHAPPDMTTMIQRLRAYMQSSGLCEFHRGRTVEWEITDCIVKGMQVVHAKKIVLPVEEEAREIEAVDLEAH